MKVIAAPGTAEVTFDVPVTRSSAIVTEREVETVPPASSRAWTNTEYWPGSRYAWVTGVPASPELSPNTQVIVTAPVPPVVKAENVRGIAGATAIRFPVARIARSGSPARGAVSMTTG